VRVAYEGYAQIGQGSKCQEGQPAGVLTARTNDLVNSTFLVPLHFEMRLRPCSFWTVSQCVGRKRRDLGAWRAVSTLLSEIPLPKVTGWS
jgi:hypothetical protein